MAEDRAAHAQRHRDVGLNFLRRRCAMGQHLDVDPGARRSATMIEPETPFRILLLGDFSGRSSTSWKPVEVDRDNFEEVLARVGPVFSGLRFQQLDDFHPDRIYEQSRLFQGLREVRRSSSTPNWRSNVRIAVLSGGCAMPRRLAARPKWSSSATAMK